jgi:hypothetical protein
MKKRDLKEIKKLADNLPPSKSLQKFSVILNGKKEYKFRLVDIDHYSRLKHAHSKNKETGMKDYIVWLKSNNEKVNKMFNQ